MPHSFWGQRHLGYNLGWVRPLLAFKSSTTDWDWRGPFRPQIDQIEAAELIWEIWIGFDYYRARTLNRFKSIWSVGRNQPEWSCCSFGDLIWPWQGNDFLATYNVQKCRKIRGLGCVNQACTRARVTQPSQHIFLHICMYWLSFSKLDRNKITNNTIVGCVNKNCAKFTS